jgi:hypothetical protein
MALLTEREALAELIRNASLFPQECADAILDAGWYRTPNGAPGSCRCVAAQSGSTAEKMHSRPGRSESGVEALVSGGVRLNDVSGAFGDEKWRPLLETSKTVVSTAGQERENGMDSVSDAWPSQNDLGPIATGLEMATTGKRSAADSFIALGWWITAICSAAAAVGGWLARGGW